MPYIHIDIARDGVTFAQKEQLIHEANAMMARILHTDADSTFVVIDEVDSIKPHALRPTETAPWRVQGTGRRP